MSTELNTTQNADQIAYEINFIKQQTLETVLAASFQIGERLCNAKELVPHGQWADWLKEKVDYSQSTAELHMRIYKEYGDEQITLSGKSKSQTFGILTFSQAVALFALPEHEREKFVEENNVSEMTTKEFKEAIAAKKAAEQEAERLKNELRTAHESAEKRNEKLKKQAEKAKSKNDSLKNANEMLSVENDKLKSELEAANKKMQEIASQPAELSEAEKEEIRRQVEEKYSGQIEQLTLDAETARQQAEQIAAEKAELERKAAQMANSDVIKIQALFEQMQNQLKSMRPLIAALPEDKSMRMTELILNTAAQILGK